MFAQDIDDSVNERKKEETWICLSADMAMYNAVGTSFGGGLAVAYGTGISIGIKAAYFIDIETQTDVLELCFLLRYYINGFESSSGPFIQVAAGQAVFFRRENGLSFPAQWGALSFGVIAGWRFLFGDMFYAEPFIRGGFPYFIGAGLGTGVKF